MRRRIPAIPGHLTRRVLAVLAASASAAALLAAAPPGPVLADHVDTSSRPGYIWTVGTSSHTTWKEGTHTNNWECVLAPGARWCQDGKIAPDPGQGLSSTRAGGKAYAGDTGKSSCPLIRPPVDDDAGCGHTNRGGWEYTGHSSMRKDGTPDIYRCNLPGHPTNHGSYVDDLHTECSMWVALPECSDGQHRHGSGACEADHEPDLVCPAVVTVAVTLTWEGHDSDGNDVTKTLDCPVTECQTGQHKHGTDSCHADHTPPPCIDNLPADQTGSWTPDHAGPCFGDAERLRPGHQLRVRSAQPRRSRAGRPPRMPHRAHRAVLHLEHRRDLDARPRRAGIGRACDHDRDAGLRLGQALLHRLRRQRPDRDRRPAALLLHMHRHGSVARRLSPRPHPPPAATSGTPNSFPGSRSADDWRRRTPFAARIGCQQY